MTVCYEFADGSGCIARLTGAARCEDEACRNGQVIFQASCPDRGGKGHSRHELAYATPPAFPRMESNVHSILDAPCFPKVWKFVARPGTCMHMCGRDFCQVVTRECPSPLPPSHGSDPSPLTRIPQCWKCQRLPKIMQVLCVSGHMYAHVRAEPPSSCHTGVPPPHALIELLRNMMAEIHTPRVRPGTCTHMCVDGAWVDGPRLLATFPQLQKSKIKNSKNKCLML
jgi:hypothetical protein